MLSAFPRNPCPPCVGFRSPLTFGSLSSARFGLFVHVMETTNLPYRSGYQNGFAADQMPRNAAVARAQGPRDHSSSGEMNSKEAMPLTAPNAPVTLAT
jgi:hypothetical protein